MALEGYKDGDEIDIRRGDRVTKVRVLQIPGKKQVAKSEAADLYQIVGQAGQAGDPQLP